jgi:hypothetical protein
MGFIEYQQFIQVFFTHRSHPPFSTDYLERSKSNAGLGASMPGMIDSTYEEYVARYGRDNADYLMSVMGVWTKHYTRAVFIDTGQGDTDHFEKVAREQAQQRGWQFERRMGNRRLLEMLVNGQWDSDEFLVVPPGFVVRQSADTSLIEALPI